ncbi:MAG: protein kinase [Candidatus Latescibacteria bacterium]|nr:protein kinase [Candidatus Latescibacterota bacterium]
MLDELGLLDDPHAEEPTSSEVADDKGIGRLGSYRLLRELGRGGQGRVFLAEDERLSRQVALKVLPPSFLTTDDSLARFRREAEVASRLDHPGICTVYEAGEFAGQCYISMQFVEGESLATQIARMCEESENRKNDSSTSSHRRRAITVTVQLIEKVARALHTAHEADLVHRDIKPGNIMVAREGTPILLDFGLARDAASAMPTLTEPGAILGTPAYMSPEQLGGDNSRVDRRTDVYSLGATLYQCLTLNMPFGARTIEGLCRAVLSEAPPNPRSSDPGISKDLAVVIETAMQKDPGSRYQTALDFAEDLRRVRMFEPIAARPAGPVLRLRRWIQRSPMAAAFVGLLLVSLVVSLLLLDQTSQALQRAKGSILTAQAQATLESDPGTALLLALEGEKLAPGLRASNALLQSVMACREQLTIANDHGEVTGVTFSPDGRLLLILSKDRTAQLVETTSGTPVHDLGTLHDPDVQAVFSPDGTQLATASTQLGDGGNQHGYAELWDIDAGHRLATLKGHEDRIKKMCFSPDGRLLATASEDTTARIWDAGSGTLLQTLRGHKATITDAAFSADGDRFATASMDGTLRVWNPQNGDVISILKGHEDEVRSLNFHPDGQRLVSGSKDKTAKIWDLATGEESLRLSKPTNSVRWVRFSPDGRRVMAVTQMYDPNESEHESFLLWDAETGRELSRQDLSFGISNVIWSSDDDPQGWRVAIAYSDGVVSLWAIDAGTEIARFRGHTDSVQAAAFAANGNHLATASEDETVRIWMVGQQHNYPVLRGHTDAVTPAHWSPDGERIVTAASDDTARIWNARTGDELIRITEHTMPVYPAIFSPDGNRVLTASFDKTVAIWDAATGARTARLEGHNHMVFSGSFSPDGTRVVTASFDGTARMWDTETGRCLKTLEGHTGKLFFVVFSPDGRRIATTSDDQTARLWDAQSGIQLHVLEGHRSKLFNLAYTPDSRRLVTTADNGTARLWDAQTGLLIANLVGHAPESPMFWAAASPDSRVVGTTSRDGTARLWDAQTGQLLHVLRHDGDVVNIAFSPNSLHVVTASLDWTARVWEVKTGHETLTLSHTDSVLSAEFSPDGQRIVTSSTDKTARIWPLDPVAAAQAHKPRELTPEELAGFLSGTGQ